MIIASMGVAKLQLRKKALTLRQQGWSYREIMREVPVAKSTISLWLRSVGLSKRQKQRLTEKKLMSIKRGAEARRNWRLETTARIIREAKQEIVSVSKREFWLLGIMLYWAEGSKEKAYRRGAEVRFTNTDPDMIHLFLHWLKEFFNKTLQDITLDTYIHATQKHRTQEIIDFWSDVVGCSKDNLRHVYYKNGNPKTKRKNIGADYHGTLVIRVKSSTLLNRRIAGWTRGVVEYLR